MTKTFLVTGAGSGIGHQLTQDLLRLGHRVIAADIDLSRFEREPISSKQNTRLVLKELDVRDPRAWRRLFDGLEQEPSPCHAVFNIAGFLRTGISHLEDDEAVELSIDINLKGVMHGTNAAARFMQRQGYGHIINMASLAGIAPVPGLAAYSAAKHGVRGFSLSVARELAPHGISVTVVCPGLVNTPMLDAQLHHASAEFTFSSPRALSVNELSSALIAALKTRPLELVITAPFSGQGVASRLFSTFPGLIAPLEPLIRRLGRSHQKRLGRRFDA